MDNMEKLQDDVLNDVAGGAAKIKVYGQSTDPNGAHWQPKDHKPGETFEMNGHTWYVIKSGDTLFLIAQKFNTDMYKIKRMNPLTIQDIGKIYAGDAIVVLQ